MNGGHIRLNKATRQWVIYAPTRRKRPQDFQQDDHQKPAIASHKPCPFCPGQELSLEPIILEISHPLQETWQTRVVGNKFPALTPHEDTRRSMAGIYLTMPGYGKHEVVIESPDHHKDIATMSLEEVEILIKTYQKRYRQLMQVRENMLVIIFRNHGKRAGASLSHPHSQIIATGIVPHHRRWQEEEAQRYFDYWSRCVYCDIIAFELEDRQRVLEENESFLAFVPFAAEVPFEIWIMPKEHQGDFGVMTNQQRSDFAKILHNMLKKLYFKLNDPDYNYVINAAARYKADEPQLHWYCQIQPRLTTPAGFELGSGIPINPSLPELDAEFLRS